MTNNFNFINSAQAYQTKFFQFPQVLLYGEQYKTLSDGAKLGYMVLRDRLDYSLRNNWIDENNNVYFIFTNEQLQTLMHWSGHKVVKVKKELENAGLLYQRKMGFNPKLKKNLPNRLYLADLEITTQDIYAKKEPSALEPQGSVRTAPRQANSPALEPQGSVKTALRQKSQQSLEPQGSVKTALYQDKTNILDTNKIHKDTNSWDFSTNNYSAEQVATQNEDLLNHAQDFLTSSRSGTAKFFLSKDAIRRICSYARTPQTVNEFISTIVLAKNNAVKDFRELNSDTTGLGISFEEINYQHDNEGNFEGIEIYDSEIKEKVNETIQRFFNRIRAYEYDDSKQIKNVRGYLYKTMYNLFATDLNEQLEEKRISRTGEK
ncbi:replication initiator protein A (plasmid) [Lactobacillus sp. ESL0731]|uniref:replication initiator protein A n=1 Tax=unclassified Lactobacillus TaxID=2620435 RepID=UPI0023F95582|nr:MULTISPECIES: replication initiator protein A [unclassified Lactobacillus]WEV52074.1 replication initiator protein A [Lactobacillus sp. ESL0700]WEV63235.1 replication initiator protein A [Lactobacillus sp. ESL0731]